MSDSNIQSNLETLSTNIQDIINSLEAIHSKDYAGVAVSLAAIATQSQQMEAFGCESSLVVTELAEKLDDSDLVEKSKSAHGTIHVLGKSVDTTLAALIRILESQPAFPDIGKNVNMILARMDADFFSKSKH